MLTQQKADSLSDAELAQLTPNASNKEIDRILLSCNERTTLMPKTAKNLIIILSTKNPSNTKAKQFIKLKKHLRQQEWANLIVDYKIDQWAFKSSISNRTHIQSSFLLECLNVNPLICLPILEHENAQFGTLHKQLLAHLYRYYQKGLKQQNHLIQFAQRCITLLESKGIRTEPDSRFLFPFSQTPKNSTLFHEHYDKHIDFYLMCTNKRYIAKLDNFDRMICLTDKSNHQAFTNQITRFWIDQCKTLLDGDWVKTEQVRDAITTNKLILQMLPEHATTPPELRDTLARLQDLK
ncbi:hypothetical protein [Vibrio owensii]|uniref:hypothetical protein n=1 Tax=Vibrio owensii TaxID=696485 RepID=UPI0018F15C32|nr:hypothetical protein [Vibrio owensii]